MASNAFQKALSQEALRRAWRDIYGKASRDSRNTVGIDGVSINDFEPHHRTNIAHLSRELQAGVFKFSSLKPTLIPKTTSGKYRLISVPTVRDRIVQRALVAFLSRKYHQTLANDISYGFVNGRSVKQAADRACAMRTTHPWVFKTDITSFFDMIDREVLCAAIRKQIREKSLHNILCSAVACEVDDTDPKKAMKIAKLGIQRGRGIRQGMPVSPLFSNFLLIPFDRRIEASGACAIRYADDLIFFAKSHNECLKIAEFCKAEFEKLNLNIPPIEPGSKSVIYAPGQAAEFLGLELSPLGGLYELRLSTTQIARIREELLQFGSIKELLSRKITLTSLGPILTAKRSGYLAAYDVCTNISEVALHLSDVEQRALRKVYRDGLGIDLKTISNEARAFLGLR